MAAGGDAFRAANVERVGSAVERVGTLDDDRGGCAVRRADGDGPR